MGRMTWEAAFELFNSLREIEQMIIRQAAVQRLIDYGFEEVGSSDRNHSVYDLISSGEYKDILREYGIEAA